MYLLGVPSVKWYASPRAIPVPEAKLASVLSSKIPNINSESAGLQ